MDPLEYYPLGRLKELEKISLDEVVECLRLYLSNFLLDDDVAMAYAERIIHDSELSEHPMASRWLAYLLTKAVEAYPFDVRNLNLYCRLVKDPAATARLKKIGRMDTAPRIWDLTGCLGSELRAEKTRIMFRSMLEKSPGHVLAAAQLLRLDALFGVAPDEWLHLFTPPPFVAEDWLRHLFVHYASLGFDEHGRHLWKSMPQDSLNTTELNAAAEMWVRSGKLELGVECYKKSLAHDPVQAPVARRLAELKQPSSIDESLPDKCDVCICLYSWNKAEFLENTLKGLAESNIGRATIRVLLNGCDDGSDQVAQTARSLFSKNDFEVIELPVNIGAPGARNWLLSLPEVQKSDYVAFLDDDIDLEPDWLARFLSVMEAHPKTAVVGAKVVFVGEGMYQFLYRSLSLARPGMFKLTDTSPIARYDNGLYDVIKKTDTVMGCCHLLRVAALADAPFFDIRYSPSQLDDIAHDIDLRLAGWEVRYCGLVKCVHHQNSGANFAWSQNDRALGNVLGNDLKFYFCLRKSLPELRKIRAAQLEAAPNLT